MKDIWFEGIWGVLVGDALGMPVQFKSRAELKKYPVTTMQGYGTYNMPPGAWSDDSSMTLATLDSIKEKKGIDYDDIMERFIDWNLHGKYTPTGKSFDQGFTCMEAIMNYARYGDYKTCGKTGERANGNGALMRIIPVCLYAYEKRKDNVWSLEEAVECVHQVSALTHNHLRSKIACGIYFFMVTELIRGTGGLVERLQAGMDEALEFYRKNDANHIELAHYERMFSLKEFAKCREEEMNSSGYVVDSLEAAVWSLITTDSLKEALLKAVNLGDDTDTVGAIAGGMGMLYYGHESVPQEWEKLILQHDKDVVKKYLPV